MTIKEARAVKVGEFVKIRNTHIEKKTENDACIWEVVGTYEVPREKRPMMIFELRLVKGSYYLWDDGDRRIIHEGESIKRRSSCLQKIV